MQKNSKNFTGLIIKMEYNLLKYLKKYGFDPNVLGAKRRNTFTERLKKQTQRVEGFKDTRKDNSGRPSTKELSLEEQIERLKHKNKVLQQENDFFKKSEIYQQKANFKTIEEQTVRENYELIDRTLNSKNNVLTVSYLCENAGVSRSGFYSWKKRKTIYHQHITRKKNRILKTSN